MALMDTTTGEIAQPPAAITVVIETIHSGDFAAESGQIFADLVKTCVQLQRPGKLVMTINVKPKDPYVLLDASVQATPPKSDPAAAVLWPDDIGNLHRSDPNQQSLL